MAQETESNATPNQGTCALYDRKSRKLGKLELHMRTATSWRRAQCEPNLRLPLRNTSSSDGQLQTRSASYKLVLARRYTKGHRATGSDSQILYTTVHDHCDRHLDTTELESSCAPAKEEQESHSHVGAPSRARACKGYERRKWSSKCRITTTRGHAASRWPSAAWLLRAAIAAKPEPNSR